MGKETDNLDLKARFGHVMHLTGEGVCDYHLPPNASLNVCDNWAAILGYAVVDIPGVPIFNSWWGQQIHPSDHARVIKTFNRLYSGEIERLVCQFKIRHKDGHYLDVEVLGTALTRDQKGWAEHVFTVMRDLRFTDDRYLQIVESLQEGIWVIDKNHNMIYTNQRLLDMLGCNRDELQVQQLFQMMSGDYARSCKAKLKHLKAGTSENYEIEFLHQDGHSLMTEVSMTAMEDVFGIPDGFIISVVDISQQRTQALQLKMLSGAVEQSGTMVMITNRPGDIEYVNPKVCKVTGYSTEDIIGQKARMLLSEDSAEAQRAQMLATIDKGEDWHGEAHIRKKNGDLFWALTTVSAIHDETGQISHYISVGEDVSELKEAHLKMEQLAYVDSLTGLANRLLFRDRLEQVLKSVQRNTTQAALLFLDLDQFKRINDSLGHDVGDALLMKVAEMLRQCVRHQDTVARMGGDEFVILLTDVDGMAGASAVARKILKIMENPNRLLRHEIIVTPSIGITMAPADSLNADILLKNADLAMYRAKSMGRNNYQFFTEEMNAQVLDNLMIENELRQAIDNNELVLDFQPQMSLQASQLTGVEALVRWIHPEKGLMDPIEFIPVAEQAGLMIPLGEWILRNACRQWREVEREGMPPVKLAVNLSARQFRDQYLLEMIQDIMAETDFKPIQLQLEITETTLMDNLEHAVSILEQIKSLGISVSIDDFGTGYSSLNYLKRLPIDELKVDRSFIRDIPEDTDDMAITSAVIAMAHELKIKVVAEGVETREQWDFLKQNKCDYGQGYLLGKPARPRELLKRFADKTVT
ncbi:MAG: EAL and GGDEF domain-containing protein [Gammaproteobacteria bacterium]